MQNLHQKLVNLKGIANILFHNIVSDLLKGKLNILNKLCYRRFGIKFNSFPKNEKLIKFH